MQHCIILVLGVFFNKISHQFVEIKCTNYFIIYLIVQKLFNYVQIQSLHIYNKKYVRLISNCSVNWATYACKTHHLVAVTTNQG